MARQLYEMQEWEDLPSENTPISGERLEHIEQGIRNNSEKMALKEIYEDNNIKLTSGYSRPAGAKAIQHGLNVQAAGNYSYARGNEVVAQGAISSAEGIGTMAVGEAQNVDGKYNVPNPNYVHITGGGTSNNDKKNIYTLDWNGNAVFAGNVTNGNGVSLDSLKESIDYILSIIQPNEDEEGGETT